MPVPFLAIDEEGAKVSRLGKNPNFTLPDVGDMRTVGESGDVGQAEKVGETLGTHLAELGFNMDMAPDADVLTNPKNDVIGKRSF